MAKCKTCNGEGRFKRAIGFSINSPSHYICAECKGKGIAEMKIIYISGPITGTSHYADRFQACEDLMLHLHPGSTIKNPVKFCSDLPEWSTWGEYMKVCIREIKSCSHIFMMDGWEDSKGACIENILASEYGLRFL